MSAGAGVVPSSDADEILAIDVHSTEDPNGRALGSTGLPAYEIQATGLAGLRGTTPNRVECYATALVGITLDSTNRKWAASTRPNAPSEVMEVGARFDHGAIIRLTPAGAPTAAVSALTVVYQPIVHGMVRRKARAQNQFVTD